MTPPRRRNPAGVPVLLMNPDEDEMAKRRAPRRKTTTRRRSTRRAAAPRANPRRRRRRAPARKRRTTRRRRNPTFDFMGTLIAALGGAAVGGGAYALEGVDVTNNIKALILGGGGLAIAALGSAYNKPAAFGIGGAGAGIAVKMLLDEYMAKQDVEGLGRIPGYAYNKFGATPMRPHYMHMPQTYAQLDAVQADLGAVTADLGAVYADFN